MKSDKGRDWKRRRVMVRPTVRGIVVAQDDAAMTGLLRELLRPLGRPIHEAEDGTSVLSLVRAVKPSLLILDLNMPKRSGYEILRVLRRDAELRNLPVLVLTGQRQPETADRVRAAGGDACLSRPIHVGVVRDRVSNMLDAPVAA